MMTDPELRASLTGDLEIGISSPAERLTRLIADSFGAECVAILHYGSHSHATNAPPSSAYDFFVIVDDNANAYRSFTARLGPRFSARTASALARILPPNFVGVTLPGDSPDLTLRGKCAVLSLRDFAAECGPDSKDHFTKGRLFQPVRLALVRDEAGRRAIEDALIAARAGTFAWVRPHLPAAFDTAEYCRTLLSTSYAGEIRLEKNTRAVEVFAAEREFLVALYDALLRKLAADGVLRKDGNDYRQTHPASFVDRTRIGWYFRRSKLRAMVRWGKSILLFDRWLDYLREKAERHSGTVIELSPRERRWPLIFLWPRAVRFMASRR
jgi:hypothetical protein